MKWCKYQTSPDRNKLQCNNNVASMSLDFYIRSIFTRLKMKHIMSNKYYKVHCMSHNDHTFSLMEMFINVCWKQLNNFNKCNIIALHTCTRNEKTFRSEVTTELSFSLSYRYALPVENIFFSFQSFLQSQKSYDMIQSDKSQISHFQVINV